MLSHSCAGAAEEDGAGKRAPESSVIKTSTLKQPHPPTPPPPPILNPPTPGLSAAEALQQQQTGLIPVQECCCSGVQSTAVSSQTLPVSCIHSPHCGNLADVPSNYCILLHVFFGLLWSAARASFLQCGINDVHLLYSPSCLSNHTPRFLIAYVCICNGGKKNGRKRRYCARGA